MIRVTKPATPPILSRRGIEVRQAQCDAYSNSPQDYNDGSKSFDHDRSIYNAKSVKNALIKAQHSKCCYCEWKATPGSFGDVEHFRPKAGFQQEAGDPLGRPGYYWLAYDWPNLYLSCQVCNQQFKRNLFPLTNAAQRARNHLDNTTFEQPLLIDPGTMEPSLYIAFREEIPYAIDGNAIGQTTIEILGLQRSNLIEDRRTLLIPLKLLKKNRDLLAAQIEDGDSSPESTAQLAENDAFLDGCKVDSAEYAAMVRAVLNS